MKRFVIQVFPKSKHLKAEIFSSLTMKMVILMNFWSQKKIRKNKFMYKYKKMERDFIKTKMIFENSQKVI